MAPAAPSPASADPIEAAIARAAAVPAMVQGSIRLSTGRVVGIITPPDLTDGEFLELVAGIARDMRQTQREAAVQRSRLLVPR